MKNVCLEGHSLLVCCAVLSMFRRSECVCVCVYVCVCVCGADRTLLGLTDTKLGDGPSVPNICDYLPVDTE